MRLNAYIYIYVYVMHMSVYMYMYVYMYVYKYMYVYVYMCIHMFIFMYMSVYICTYRTRPLTTLRLSWWYWWLVHDILVVFHDQSGGISPANVGVSKCGTYHGKQCTLNHGKQYDEPWEPCSVPNFETKPVLHWVLLDSPARYLTVQSVQWSARTEESASNSMGIGLAILFGMNIHNLLWLNTGARLLNGFHP